MKPLVHPGCATCPFVVKAFSSTPLYTFSFLQGISKLVVSPGANCISSLDRIFKALTISLKSNGLTCSDVWSAAVPVAQFDGVTNKDPMVEVSIMLRHTYFHTVV